MVEEIKKLIMNQYLPSENFDSDTLEQIDYKIHDIYQEYTDSHLDLPAEEIVQILAFGVHIRNKPEILRKKLLEEFMTTNLAKLYVLMVEERKERSRQNA